MDDSYLLRALCDPDPEIARIARRIMNGQVAGEPAIAEPRHCSECFEGCPKCEGN